LYGFVSAPLTQVRSNKMQMNVHGTRSCWTEMMLFRKASMVLVPHMCLDKPQMNLPVSVESTSIFESTSHDFLTQPSAAIH